jgi:hypothetical protein
MSAGPEPPTRVDEAPAPRVRERRWWPALVVALSILALVVGGQLVRGALPAVSPVTVGDVRVQPRPGWELDATQPGVARLRRGSAVLDIYAAPRSYTGPEGLAASYVDQVLRPGLSQLTTAQPTTTTIAGGVPAVRVGYVGLTPDGVAIEGVLVAADGPRSGVVFDAAAPEGTLATVVGDVDAMIDQAVFAV